jgi:hypothetical protein
MDVDYKELERVAGLTDLVDPNLGNTLQQLLSDLRDKNAAFKADCEKSPGWVGPVHDGLVADLEIAVTAILTYFKAYGYVARKVSSGMWGTHHIVVHPLYTEAFDEKWHPLLGWESNMGNVPKWAAVIVRQPLVDRIMWDEE